jgi:two-component system nitrate/nitrite response regulator NarL
MTEKIRLVLVDDHPMFRAGVYKSLGDLGFEIVGEGATASDAVSLVTTHCPEAVLLDISMPGNGLSAVQAILANAPATKVVILTASEDGDDVRSAMQLGACGYVLKGIGSRDLASVVQTVVLGGSYVPPKLSARLISECMPHPAAMQEQDHDGLSAREREVMDLIAVGMSNKLVARKLGLHEKTVKHHATRIFAKLSVSNRTEAALRWRK